MIEVNGIKILSVPHRGLRRFYEASEYRKIGDITCGHDSGMCIIHCRATRHECAAKATAGDDPSSPINGNPHPLCSS